MIYSIFQIKSSVVPCFLRYLGEINLLKYVLILIIHIEQEDKKILGEYINMLGTVGVSRENLVPCLAGCLYTYVQLFTFFLAGLQIRYLN